MWAITLAVLFTVASAEIHLELSELTQDPTKEELTRDSISFEKKVIGYKSQLSRALDGNVVTAFKNRDAFETMSAVDLGAVYDIQQISLYVKGLREENRLPFSMLLSEKFSLSDHRDDYENSVKILRDFQFTAANQHLNLTLSGFQGQYLSFVDQNPFIFKLPRHGQFLISEIVVRGQKVRESTEKVFQFNVDWSAVPEKFKRWQYGKDLTEGVPEMWTDPAQHMIPLALDQACVFGSKDGCTAIAGTVGNGKFFATTSTSLLNEVLEQGTFPRFKSNLKAWLCPQCNGESRNNLVENKINILDVESQYSPEKVKEFLDQGNAVIILISYRAQRKEYQLLAALDIGIQGSMRVLRHSPLEPEASCKYMLPVDVIFGLMGSSVETFAKVNFTFNSQMFYMDLVRQRLTDELRVNTGNLINQLHGFGPSVYNKVSDKPARKLIDYLRECVAHLFQDHLPYPILPGSSQFPPSTSDVAQRSTVRVTSTTYSGFQRISTGLGVGRGEAFSYRVIEGDVSRWKVIIGNRRDKLYRKTAYVRYPSITHEFSLKSSDTLVAYNTGIIYLYHRRWLARHGSEPKRITVEFSNVYRTAVYDRRLPKPLDYWRKTYEATEYPLAEITGEMVNRAVVLSYLAESKGEDIAGVTELLDKWFIINQNVRGTDWSALRGDIMAWDVQISAGWGHSGYPIMGHLPWHLPSIKKVLEVGAWGQCHELGHNYQQGSWKLPNTGEVTNNLLCIYNYNETISVPTFTYPMLRFGESQLNDLKNHWKSDNWPAKMYQLNYYLLFGWKFGKGFWANVIYFLNNVEKEKPEFNTLEYLVYAMSKQIGYDFSPYHQLYNMPLGDAVKMATSEFGECWMPDRDLTVDVEDKIARIEDEHGRQCTRKSKVIEPFIDLRRDIDLVRKDRVKATIQEVSGAHPSGYIPA